MRMETTGYRRREIARWRRMAAVAAFWLGVMALAAMPSYVARTLFTGLLLSYQYVLTHP